MKRELEVEQETDTDLTASHAGRMSPQDYRRERLHLRATYGDSTKEAGARFEQGLARLFYRSGWTQAELAKAEGKSQAWISYRVLFGRFLEFITTVINPENPHFSKLTERGFRVYWERTNSAETNERIRFREVMKLIESSSTQAPHRPAILADIIKAFADDGLFHRASTIAKKVGADEAYVVQRLKRCHIERKIKIDKIRRGKNDEYRIFRTDHAVSFSEISEKLTPILEQFEAQGKQAPGSVSNAQILTLVAHVRNLLKKWRE